MLGWGNENEVFVMPEEGSIENDKQRITLGRLGLAALGGIIIPFGFIIIPFVLLFIAGNLFVFFCFLLPAALLSLSAALIKNSPVSIFVSFLIGGIIIFSC